MTTSEIIDAFETYVDDTTELSSVTELTLAKKIYMRVCRARPWEILKKEASGFMLSTTTIAKPSDFEHFVENRNRTDNSQSEDYNARPVGILINDTKWLQIINWADRRQYANMDGYAYLDLQGNLIHTTYAQPSSATYSFDYKFTPPALTLGTSPVFPEDFHPIIYHGMAVDDMIIQLFPRSQSYAAENQAAYNSYMADMAIWNANLLLN